MEIPVLDKERNHEILPQGHPSTGFPAWNGGRCRLAFGTPGSASARDDTGGRRSYAYHECGPLGGGEQAQERYEQVLKTGLGERYMAPLRTNRDGPRYLWGGLDPIALVESYERQIVTDKGGIVFIGWGGAEIGRAEFPLDVPIYVGGPTKTALFRSAENRDNFRRQSTGETLMVMCGLNCLWGLAAGPATSDRATRQASHFAQPGLAGIFVERMADPQGREVATLGATLYVRADDWHAVQREGWGYIAEAFQSLLQEKKPWRRVRPYMPVVELDLDNPNAR